MTRTRVVFLQHPREARVAIGTARMAHLALPNSELHEGISFSGRGELEALAADPSAAVLFPWPWPGPWPSPFPFPVPWPGPGGEADDGGEPPRVLFVVDGTWPQARSLIRRNPMLSRMRRLAITPTRPGAYRIRREPAPECLATVEAVAAALGELEGDVARFAAMLSGFDFMVEQQLACARANSAPRRREGRAASPPLGPELAALSRARDQIVLLHGEANAHGSEERTAGAPELLHLVASRPSRAVHFEAFLAPRRPLGARTALHLDVDRERLLDGETGSSAMLRFAAFLGPDDRLCGWGPFALDLLGREGLARHPRIDLRAIYTRRLPGHPRGLERAAGALGVPVAAPWAAGRAGRMMAQLEAVLEGLLSARATAPARP